ncbi:unnamed protein product, partial [Ectocarpus sp. 12 AP-2014]
MAGRKIGRGERAKGVVREKYDSKCTPDLSVVYGAHCTQYSQRGVIVGKRWRLQEVEGRGTTIVILSHYFENVHQRKMFRDRDEQGGSSRDQTHVNLSYLAIRVFRNKVICLVRSNATVWVR